MQTKDFTVRSTVQGDIKTIAELLSEHFQFMRNTFSHAAQVLEWPHSKEGLKFISDFVPGDEKYCSWIAQSAKGKPIGYLLGKLYDTSHRYDNPISEIDNVFVKEDYRGIGAGKKLIMEFNAWSLERNVKRMKAKTYAENFDAHKAYEKLGMKQIEVVYEIPKFT